MVLEVLLDGRFGAVRGIARIDNTDAAGVQRADAHGIRVRRLAHHGHDHDADDAPDDDEDDKDGGRDD
jgi:hypothetical protein